MGGCKGNKTAASRPNTNVYVPKSKKGVASGSPTFGKPKVKASFSSGGKKRLW